MKKRLVGVLLVFFITINSLPRQANAAEFKSPNNYSKKSTLIEEVATLQKQFPTSEIRVANGMIHIVLSEHDRGLIKSSDIEQQRTTSVYAPNGGAYRDFSISGFSMLIPLSQVYMSSDAVQARLLQLSEPTFYHWVVQQLEQGLVSSVIALAAYSTFGISVTSAVVSIIGSFTVWGLSNIDYYSLQSVSNRSSTGKVEMLHYITPDGYFAMLYYVWESNYCTTQGGYSATWYGGDYEF